MSGRGYYATGPALDVPGRLRLDKAVPRIRATLQDAGRVSEGDRVRCSGLLTWSEIWCDVENSKSFRSSRNCRVSPGHRLKGASALHNFLASIFTAPGVTTWSDMSGNTRKNQVTRLVTVRHRSTMSGVLVLVAAWGQDDLEPLDLLQVNGRRLLNLLLERPTNAPRLGLTAPGLRCPRDVAKATRQFLGPYTRI